MGESPGTFNCMWWLDTTVSGGANNGQFTNWWIGSCDSAGMSGRYYLGVSSALCPYDGGEGQWFNGLPWGAGANGPNPVSGHVTAIHPPSPPIHEHVAHHAAHHAHNVAHHVLGAIIGALGNKWFSRTLLRWIQKTWNMENL